MRQHTGCAEYAGCICSAHTATELVVNQVRWLQQFLQEDVWLIRAPTWRAFITPTSRYNSLKASCSYYPLWRSVLSMKTFQGKRGIPDGQVHGGLSHRNLNRSNVSG